ncbi:unnamed protein product [Adineta ricciae]|uniref:Uncharacterized protein n=1 Tax=Adineta ricciae TaxID=249248 RepID=A0A814PB02_ADIRI|nr:unnamed protein product [Adineta ricciae]
MSWREGVNKQAAKPAAPKPKFESKDDDWETDTSYENTVTEKTQRYGSKSIPGSGRVDHFDLNTIQDKVKTADVSVTSVYREKNPTRGYGGKYGSEQVMDKVQ